MLYNCFMFVLFVFFFKQKTAYEMRISDWSSDVCSSDLPEEPGQPPRIWPRPARSAPQGQDVGLRHPAPREAEAEGLLRRHHRKAVQEELFRSVAHEGRHRTEPDRPARAPPRRDRLRSEEHTSELQSIMRISYAVFCLKKTKGDRKQT